jgi:HAD superfamily hydrolase (TIGR01509 family)
MAQIEGILFDVDGTLYCQRTVRRAMLVRLLRSFWSRPSAGYQAARLLQSYRRAQELLRSDSGVEQLDLAERQIRKACQLCGHDAKKARALVTYWMETNPLDLMRPAMRTGIEELLRQGRQAGIRLGVVSDYPAEAKLAAMGIRQYFDVVICAQDPDVQCFKPDPRPLLAAMHRLGTTPESTLYIGDRPGIDDLAAQRAGMTSALICDVRTSATRSFRTFGEITEWLFSTESSWQHQLNP